MAIFPCDNKGLCIDPANPFQNFSAEAPDQETFIGFDTGFGPTDFYPPLGSDFFAVGCRSFCVSDVSQKDADQCAARTNVDCLARVWPVATLGTDIFGNPTPLYRRRNTFLNREQSTTVTCPDGIPFTYTVPAGVYEAFSQEDADQAALSDAQENAPLFLICLSDLTVPQACPNVDYEASITASGMSLTDDTVCWTLIGSLPPGLESDLDESDNCETGSRTLNFFGTPTTPGNYTFTILVNDKFGNSMFKSFTIRIEGIMDVNPMPDGNVNTAYSQTLSAIGVTNPIYSLEGGTMLPTGLSLDSTGVIFGTPTVQGTVNFTLGVTEAGTGITCLVPASIKVKPPLFTWANLVWGAPFLQQGNHGNTASAVAAGAHFDVKTTNPLDTSTQDAIAIISGTMTYNGPAVLNNNLALTVNCVPANGNGAFMIQSIHVTSAQNGSLLAIGNQPAGNYNSPFTVPATVGNDTLTVTVTSRSFNGFNNILVELIGTLTP